MTSARKIEANRRNAQASTGPRTPEGKSRAAQNGRASRGPKTLVGKARSAQNARRHGLTVPDLYDEETAREIEVLARAIAGEEASSERRAGAERIAAAQREYVRVREVQHALLGAGHGPVDLARRLPSLERY